MTNLLLEASIDSIGLIVVILGRNNVVPAIERYAVFACVGGERLVYRALFGCQLVMLFTECSCSVGKLIPMATPDNC